MESIKIHVRWTFEKPIAIIKIIGWNFNASWIIYKGKKDNRLRTKENTILLSFNDTDGHSE